MSRHSVPSGHKAQHTFAMAPQANIPRASFNRSHGIKTTFNAGYLVPFFVDEVLPGDSFKVNTTLFARLATPIYPLMDNLWMETFFFFVPNRLVWSHWQAFNGEQLNPADSTNFILPTCTAPGGGVGVSTGDLQDYMGLPIKVASIVFQNLPFRAYNLIYREWFRDENMQNSPIVDLGDGPDTYSNYVLLRRGKRHDYFTSCLPWPQKINDGTVVSIPLGTTAPVVTTTAVPTFSAAGGSFTNRHMTAQMTTNAQFIDGAAIGVTDGLIFGSTTGLQANLSAATAATINQLRQAFQLQKLYERDARGGTRYTEIVRSHFGVISPDARLQRPEYLGGGSQIVGINPVAQTSGTSITGEATPQGNLAGFGTVSASGHGFSKSFTEHGHIIGLVSVRADLNYQQGMNRMWSRSIRWDFYWPALSHIGEQAVLNKEIYMDGSGNDTAVFGYQERFGEYRYKPGQITGLFRSTATTPLDAWHLAQNFGSLPTLNTTFIQETPPMSRVKAVSSQPDFIFDGFINMTCVRPMPLYGVPGLIDHF